ncbi:MAG: DUF2807 domain-containing protein [Bacteroidales bacterium]|nr:DUF2807 domain-containing protein [Bacteroidales bacterium]
MIITILLHVVSCSGPQASGNMLTDYRRVSDFQRLVVTGVQYLTITQGGDYQCKITADDNVLSSITSLAKDGVLVIHNKSQRRRADITVEIVMPQIQELEVGSAVNAQIQDKVLAHDMVFRINDAANLQIDNIQSDGKITAYLNGAGNLNIAGNVQTFRCLSQGAGNVFAEHLDSQNIFVKITQSGSIFVTSYGKLEAKISGSGSLVYNGEPTDIQKQITGSGNVVRR